jgi:hypothetical protein
MFRSQLVSLVRVIQSSELSMLVTHQGRDETAAIAELFSRVRLHQEGVNTSRSDAALVNRALGSDADASASR